ncbi:pentapeptide repeat-containing protein [Streptomyces sp. NPDC087300]|uniref:pentapeptide repeat-containing protein n=1 Tax=Streptomyces sp. NPDC087300 TaxID=3365780 RepID=UPI0037F1D60D
MIANLIRRRRVRRGLRLWPVGIVLFLAFATALAVAAGVFLAGWDLLGAHGLERQRRIDAATLFDLVKLAFGVVAGAGALVALVVAYRRQRVDEDGALREATRLHTERFTTAVSQLGDDSAAVRLGGVHALAGLADDAPTDLLRQTCIDVLCAYLRLPYTAEADLPPDDTAARHNYLALREVRHTIIRLIRDRTMVDPEESPLSWQGHDFDFTGVVFDGGDLSGAVFSSDSAVSFRDARFSSGKVSFRGALFAGGKVNFTGAFFSGGEVNFSGTTFSGGSVAFIRATFSGSVVAFGAATFSGGSVLFGAARFTGGKVFFKEARFTGGDVVFTLAQFPGGTVHFEGARFSGSTVAFNGTRFTGGTMYFHRARFTAGAVPFAGAEFSGGTVSFNGAQFLGGRVDFTRSTGAATPLYLPRRPLPPCLIVPDAWLPPTS